MSMRLRLLGMAAVLALLAVATVARADSKTSKNADAPPVPPKDAQYTIYCQTIAGPNHVREAKRLKDELVAATGMKGFYLMHGETDSTLFYGYYRTFNVQDPKDAKEGARAQEDRRKLAALKDAEGNPRFPLCVPVELASPDPGGPPEWNLANTPARMYWSLQIAAYTGSPERKRAAVEAVREARAQGVEAYYYHGDSVSSVCVGAWPMEAVKAQESADASTRDPNADLVVLPRPLPGVPKDAMTADGRPIQTVAPKLDVVDPALLATMQKYPYHLVNGLEQRKKWHNPDTGKDEVTADPSFLVVIEHLDTQLAVPQETKPVAPPPRQTTPGAGKLKSIGD